MMRRFDTGGEALIPRSLALSDADPHCDTDHRYECWRSDTGSTYAAGTAFELTSLARVSVLLPDF